MKRPMLDDRIELLVVAGPTASGKTQCALELARFYDGELVGADSVQVYRGFDVGSAKPTAAELGDIAHHLIDVCDPMETIDAARFAQLADAAIADIRSRGRVPIVVGGTGLWLRALLRGLVALPQVDVELRARLDDEAAKIGIAAMHARLASVDPFAASKIHPNDQLRIVRALEVHAQTGEPLGELQRRHALGEPRYRAFAIAFDLPFEELTPRIEARVDAMLARGLVDETRELVERFGQGARALGSVGYRQVVEHLRGELPEAQLREAIVRATRVYARRQRTWLRSEPGYAWHAHPAAVPAEFEAQVERFCARAGGD